MTIFCVLPRRERVEPDDVEVVALLLAAQAAAQVFWGEEHRMRHGLACRRDTNGGGEGFGEIHRNRSRSIGVPLHTGPVPELLRSLNTVIDGLAGAGGLQEDISTHHTSDPQPARKDPPPRVACLQEMRVVGSLINISVDEV